MHHDHILRSHLPIQEQLLRYLYILFEIIRTTSSILGLYFFGNLPMNLTQNENVDTISMFFIFLFIFSMTTNISNLLIYFSSMHRFMMRMIEELHTQLYYNTPSYISIPSTAIPSSHQFMSSGSNNGSSGTSVSTSFGVGGVLSGGTITNSSSVGGIQSNIISMSPSKHNVGLNSTVNDSSVNSISTMPSIALPTSKISKISSQNNAFTIPSFILDLKQSSNFIVIIVGHFCFWTFCLLNSFISTLSITLKEIVSGDFQRELVEKYRSIVNLCRLKGLYFGKDMSSHVEIFKFLFHSILRLVNTLSMELFMILIPFRSLILLQLTQRFIEYATEKYLQKKRKRSNHSSLSHTSQNHSYNNYTSRHDDTDSFNLDYTSYICLFSVLILSIMLPEEEDSFLGIASYKFAFFHLIGVVSLIISSIAGILYSSSRKSMLRTKLRNKSHIHGNFDASTYEDTKKSTIKKNVMETKMEFESFSGCVMTILMIPIVMMYSISLGPLKFLSISIQLLPLSIVLVFFCITIPDLFGQLLKQLKPSLTNGSEDNHFVQNQDHMNDSKLFHDSDPTRYIIESKSISLYVTGVLMLLAFQNVHFLSLVILFILIYLYHRNGNDEEKNIHGSDKDNISKSISSYQVPFFKDFLIFNKFEELFKSIMNHSETRYLFLFLLLNVVYMIIEFLYGVYIDSLGLISDAAHMFFDSASLFVGLYGAVMSKWPRDKLHSYGYGRYEAISGFINGLLLVFIAFFISIMAIPRLIQPPLIEGKQLMTVSIFGFVVNLIGVIYFHQEDPTHTNQNLYGVYLHMIADLLGSVGVIFSTFLIQTYGLHRTDPICSIIISFIILSSSIPLLKVNGNCLMQGISEEVKKELDVVMNDILALPFVSNLKNVHFWMISEGKIVGSFDIQLKENLETTAYQSTILEARKMLAPWVHELSIGIDD